MSDENALERIRTRLMERRAELQRRQRRIDMDLARQHEPLSKDFSDQAIQLENDETLQAIGEATVRELEEINLALDRLSRGLYGLCRNCGEEISAGRLAAIPHATICQRCAQ